MRCAARLGSAWMSLGIVGVLLCGLSAFATLANAQGTQGQDAVYNSSNGVVGSSAFIDAGMFATSQRANICAVLNFVLNPLNGIITSAGAVIDARGIPGITPPVSMTCTASPWAGITNPPASTILLPSGTIVIPSKWVLPSSTHLIGEGSTLSAGFTPGTTLQVSSSFTAYTPMIQFGSSSGCCSAISVEKLALDGGGTFVNGIENANAGDLSYVDHIAMVRILGTGLWVHGTANNSGPYSNITYDLVGYSGNSSTICANINGLSGTRGIHGLSCTAENNDPPAAVLLDSSNNSIEDVKIVGLKRCK